MKRRHVLKATGASIATGLAVAGVAGADEAGTDDVEASASCPDCYVEECYCKFYENGECIDWECQCVPDCTPDRCPCPE